MKTIVLRECGRGCAYMGTVLIGVWAAVGGLHRSGVGCMRVVPGKMLTPGAEHVVTGMCEKAHECVGGLAQCCQKDECSIALGALASVLVPTSVWSLWVCGKCRCLGKRHRLHRV